MTFQKFVGSGRIDGWKRDPSRDPLHALTDPEGYEAGEELARAVNVALALSMPLLLTGEPGTGKTQLASRLAAELFGTTPLRFDTKSSSQANDLFFSFDSMRYFARSQVNALQREDPPAAREFVRYESLGEAILRTHPRDEVAEILPSQYPSYDHGRSVVLIDEIDKAPRDFPNDLLNQVENREFSIPELGNVRVKADPALAPVVVITSNSEKQLPDPFLRRCVYHHIDFPEARIGEIVAGRLRHLPLGERGFEGAREFFFTLRDPAAGLVKKPSTSELLDWLRALGADLRFEPSRAFREQREVARGCLGTLAKTDADLKRARAFLDAPATAPRRPAAP
ncbi:MAG TPA: MoxR family ATPase [Longimicrobium sp.]|nr:MoxR family ATPase [Longimicrobium sp.]